MTIRIIFNGQEYAGTEAMPQAVRTAYQEALSKLKDTDQNGVPDILERGETSSVIMIQPSSITVNGREFKNVASMPASLRMLYEYALHQAEGARPGLSKTVAGDSGTLIRALMPRAHSEEFLRTHLRAKQTAARILPILLVFAVGGILTAGAWTVWHLDASLRRQGGGFHIGRGLLVAVALTAVAGIGIAIWMMLKRLGAPETGAPRGSAPDAPTAPAQQPNQDFLRALDTTEHTIARLLQVLLGVAAGGVVAGGVWMLSHMDPSSRSQAGDIFLGIGVLVALGCIAGMYISIEMRLKK